MRILLAAPDRDLLDSYRKLLERDCGEVVTAFDGTRVLTLLQTERFDAVILDRDIPRVTYGTVLERLHALQLPAILLTDRPILQAEPKADAILMHPFFPEAMQSALRDVTNPKKGIEAVTDHV